MLNFSQTPHLVPQLFYLMLNDQWGKLDREWTPGFSEPVVLVALHQRIIANIQEIGCYLGGVNYSDSALRESCMRLGNKGLVEKAQDRPLRFSLTEFGRKYVSEAITTTCTKLGVKIDGIIFHSRDDLNKPEQSPALEV